MSNSQSATDIYCDQNKINKQIVKKVSEKVKMPEEKSQFLETPAIPIKVVKNGGSYESKGESPVRTPSPTLGDS